jgi:predicted nucleic acid-binding protein
LSKDIAFMGGEIYSKLVRKGLEIELNDCLIAATGTV